MNDKQNGKPPDKPGGRQERRESTKRRYEQDADTSLVIFEQDPRFSLSNWEERQLRVAPYCRVSTESENQASSFTLQKKYYTEFIAAHPKWTMVDIYADEGLSATSYSKRDDFKRMLRDCEDGKVDLIITKNVSRFSRNVVDCLGIARNLLRAKHPVGIYFQENNINTLVLGNEMMLTMLSSLAQAESEAKRESMLWSYDKRFARGQFLTPTNNLLGYATDEGGNMVIEPESAKTVRAVFSLFLGGQSMKNIAYLMTYYRRPTGKGNMVWSSSSVRGILMNERFCGDVVAQKSYVTDVISHKAKKNKGQKRTVYKKDHHPAIVSRAEYVRALMLMKSRRGSVYFNPDYTLRVVRRGLLAGFIPVNPACGAFAPTHFVGALEGAEVTLPPPRGETVVVGNATVARINEFSHSTVASLTVSESHLIFNRDAVAFFGEETAFVEILFHPMERLIAVRRTDKDDKNAVLWDTKPIGASLLNKNIYLFCEWDKSIRYKIMADCFMRGDERLMMFDLDSAEFILSFAVEREATGENDEKVTVWRNISKMLQPEKWRDDFGTDSVTHETACRRWLALSLSDWEAAAPAEPVEDFENFAPADDDVVIREEDLLINFAGQPAIAATEPAAIESTATENITQEDQENGN